MPRNEGLEGASTRTFALVGHASSGKTQLAEVMLHAAGVVRQPGRVDDQAALLDFEPEEDGRHGSVFPAVAWLPWGEQVVHLIDTPGNDAGAYQARLAREGADADLLVISGPHGIELGAERVLRAARHDDRALVALVNKIDRIVDLDAVLAAMEAHARRKVVLMQLPLFDDGQLVGLVDVLEQTARRYDPDGAGTWSEEPVPPSMVPRVRAERERLLEAVALTDEALLETYLEHLDLAPGPVWCGLERAVREGTVLPVLLASASRNIGAHAVLDTMVRLTPDAQSWRLPADAEGAPRFVAQWIATRLDEDGAPVALLRVRHGHVQDNQVWQAANGGRTARLRKLYQLRGPRRSKMRFGGPGALIASWDLPPGRPGEAFTDGPHVPLEPPRPGPVMAWLQVSAAAGTRLDQVATAVERALLVDPSVRVDGDPAEGPIVLSGAYARQLDLFVDWMRHRFGLALHSGPAPVAYLERPARAVQGVHGLHRKEAGDLVSELGEVWLDVEPAEIGAALEFSCTADPFDLPAKFVPAVARGVAMALQAGPQGYETRGVRVTCVGGEHDMMESEGAHFEEAGRLAMQAALLQAGTELWEPWSDVHLFVPGADVGGVLADLAAHGGRVLGMQVADDETSIRAHCPDREVRSLSARLESLTHGRGWFVARPSHHDAVPSEHQRDASRVRTPPSRTTAHVS